MPCSCFHSPDLPGSRCPCPLWSRLHRQPQLPWQVLHGCFLHLDHLCPKTADHPHHTIWLRAGRQTRRTVLRCGSNIHQWQDLLLGLWLNGEADHWCGWPHGYSFFQHRSNQSDPERILSLFRGSVWSRFGHFILWQTNPHWLHAVSSGHVFVMSLLFILLEATWHCSPLLESEQWMSVN